MSDSQSSSPPAWPEIDEQPSPGDQKSLFLLIGSLAAILVIIVVISLVVLRPKQSDGDGSGLDPTAMSDYVVPLADPILVDSGTPQPQIQVPISLTLQGLEYAVLPYQVKADGEWLYPAGQSGKAVWVYGTIVNYVVGIEYTEANAALIESLQAGDVITMTTVSGSIYHFAFAGRERVSSSQTDIFAQTHPGLTIIALGGDDEEQSVVHADYLMVEGQQVGTGSGLSISVGEPAQLDTIRVTALSTSYIYDDPSVPEGWAFFLVDYQVENFASTILDPSRFRMELQDGAGTMYSPSLPASQAGIFGYLSLTIPPNTVAQGTAGYLVPAPLVGPKLAWSFSWLNKPEMVVKVLIDFESPAEVVEPSRMATVNLSGAELSADRTLVSVWGTVQNDGVEALVVTTDDLFLTGGDVRMPFRAADPALPWTVSPGSALGFRVSFQRPGTDTATLSVLDQPFEIGGLE